MGLFNEKMRHTSDFPFILSLKWIPLHASVEVERALQTVVISSQLRIRLTAINMNAQVKIALLLAIVLLATAGQGEARRRK